jgi:acyl-CoA thioester hydrolase
MVFTALKSISCVRICFTYRVVNAMNMKLIATGETMHAFTDKKLKPVNAKKIIPDIYSVLIKKD